MVKSLIKQGIADTKKPTLGGLFCLFMKNEFGAATGLYYQHYLFDYKIHYKIRTKRCYFWCYFSKK
ncbi:hypothetical protein V12B01_26299 [Vibrio splendidus 12B01]|nr:hypothetical protein V12B01_26299 [Vibrio splendidus 12B01]